MAIVYGLKVNLSVAIVGMRNQTAEKSGALNITHSDCPDHVRDTTTVKVSFHKGILQKKKSLRKACTRHVYKTVVFSNENSLNHKYATTWVSKISRVTLCETK